MTEIEQALEHHRAGRLQQAKTIYREMLGQVPTYHVNLAHAFRASHKVDAALEDLGLMFIGFQLPAPQTKQLYRKSNLRDVHLTDLAAWHRFEQLNPQMFAGMYVFWCQKKDSSSRVQAKKEKLV